MVKAIFVIGIYWIAFEFGKNVDNESSKVEM